MSHTTRRCRFLLAAALVAASGAALASGPPPTFALGSPDAVPAATLLLPYFEVDLNDPNGPQTRFTIANVDGAPTLAHVVLWTDLGRPTYAIDVYLGGYGSQEIDLRLLFDGVLPRTAPEAFPEGDFSAPRTPFAGCPAAADALYAGFPSALVLDDATVAHLRAAHTGQASDAFGGQCAGAAIGDGVARGYVTVDTTSMCSSAFPSDPGYFGSGGSGVAIDANVLFGSYVTAVRRDGETFSGPLVSIEASGVEAVTSEPGQSTFYGAYTGYTAVDHREPLGGVWHARHLGPAQVDPTATELIVWRQPTASAPFTCGAAEIPGTPMRQFQIVAFDDSEVAVLFDPPVSYPNVQPPPKTPFGRVTQRVPLGEISPWNAGFVHLNLNATGLPAPFDQDAVNERAQSYVVVRHRIPGQAGSDLPAALVAGHRDTRDATACRWTVRCDRFPTFFFF